MRNGGTAGDGPSTAQDGRQAYRRHMTEDQLLAAVTDAATLHGWRWTHIRRSDRAVTMGHRGFPDLVLVRGGRVIFAELKAAKGRLSADQCEWLRDLGEAEASNLEAWLIGPDQLDLALAVLGE